MATFQFAEVELEEYTVPLEQPDTVITLPANIIVAKIFFATFIAKIIAYNFFNCKSFLDTKS